MIEKYIIMISDNASIGMIYDRDCKQVSLGGNYKFRLSIESVISDYFGDEIPEPVSVQKNKLRYVLSGKSKDDVARAMNLLEDHGFVVEQVTKLGRLMI